MKIRKIVFASVAFAALIAAALAIVTALQRSDSPRAGVPTPAATEMQADSDGAATPAAASDVGDNEHILGDPDAPITIIEYASLTCPHCASFHQDTLPQLKKEWLEPGKARLVYRHYPLDRLALAAALMANCFEGKRFFGVLEMLFDRQQQWARAEKPGEELAKIAAQAGMDRATFEQCVTDQEEAQRILQTQKAGREEADIQSTPTFLIEGEKIEGAKPYGEFEKVLERVEGDA